MLGRNAALAILITLAPAFPALAQGNVTQIVNQTPKPGMSKQYEAARKKHFTWHKAQKDTWPWFTWQVMSGENTGSYIVGTFQHAWKDFDGRDAFFQADLADSEAVIGPTVAHSLVRYYIERADLSLSPSTPTSTPAPMIAISGFLLKPELVNEFIDTVKKINEGIKKTNYPQAGPSRWYQLVNGGETPLMVLVGDRATFAAFQPNDKTLDAMMEEAYGKEQGAAILASGRKAIRTTTVTMAKYRPDLSYIPAK